MRHQVALTAAALLLAAGGGAYWYFQHGPGRTGVGATPSLAAAGKTGAATPAPAGAQQQGKGPAGGPPQGPPVTIEAASPRVGVAQQTILAVGTFRSFEAVMIRPELSGRVKEILFQEGQKVARGQPLVKLDGSLDEALLVQAEAALALSKANYDRAVSLTQRQVAAERTLDEARAALRRDEAIVLLNRTRVEKYTLLAPFDGVIGLRRVSVGSLLNVGADIVNLEQIDPLKVDFRVPESFLSAVGVGQSIRVTVDAYGKKEFPGTVYAIDPLVDETGRAIVIRAQLPNPNGELRPGVFARVQLTLAQRDNALFIPEQSLMPVGESHIVFKVVDGRVAVQRVRIGQRSGAEVEIREGLTARDVVVTAGQMKIRPGQAVVIAPARPSAQTPPPAGTAPGQGGQRSPNQGALPGAAAADGG